MATGDLTHFDNDARAVDVALTASVEKDDVIVAETLLGIANRDGDSGDTISITIDDRGYQFTVPTTLDVAKGDIVYVDITDLTGHIPDDSAYYTAAGSNRIRLFLALEDKDANDVVIGKLLVGSKLS